MQVKENQTFQENTPARTYADPLNECRRCGIRAGKYTHKITNQQVGVYLMNDARGGKTCNLCANEGYHIAPRKLNKKEKRRDKLMRKEILKMKNIPHITLDAKGRRVE